MGHPSQARCRHREATRFLSRFPGLLTMDFDVIFAGRPLLRRIALVLYYLFIVLALILMYGRGDFSTPPFVYQEF